MRKSAFVVGRSIAGSTTVVVVSVSARPESPILGPWTVSAVVSAN